jgi:uncharacterized protein (UPF0333 family)
MKRRKPFIKGQALTEYALLISVVVLSIVIVNKTAVSIIGRALARIVEVVSLPFP